VEQAGFGTRGPGYWNADLAQPEPRSEKTMFIGGGILITVLVVLAIIFLAKRV